MPEPPAAPEEERLEQQVARPERLAARLAELEQPAVPVGARLEPQAVPQAEVAMPEPPAVAARLEPQAVAQARVAMPEPPAVRPEQPAAVVAPLAPSRLFSC